MVPQPSSIDEIVHNNEPLISQVTLICWPENNRDYIKKYQNFWYGNEINSNRQFLLFSKTISYKLNSNKVNIYYDLMILKNRVF